MKVLFAVSNEEISESIVKRYQKEYKEIISYKNVYYFNAILKEIQKDKTYDRIVISEELEAFTKTQYDQIDKFIFDKLDSISDEASNIRGTNAEIILICSDRREKGEDMLVKLFGIGIYDALLGNDRSVEEVCKLINKPRSKKEAKLYYKIESDDVKYQSENENDVSEEEIQNILAHYKKLGRNEDKYVTSFDNIVAQYNDAQLRIISKFLPLNVRAVLEEKSPKYQQVMSFNNAVTNSIRKKSDKEEDLGPSGKLLNPKNRNSVLTGPIVIPSSVNTKNVRKLTRSNPAKEIDIQEDNPLRNLESDVETAPTVKQANQSFEDAILGTTQAPKRRGRPKKNLEEVEETVQETPKRRGRPRKNPIPEALEELEDTILPGFENVNPVEPISQIQSNNVDLYEEEDSVLPGFEDYTSNEPVQPVQQKQAEPEYKPNNNAEYIDNEPAILPGFESINNNEQQIRNQENNSVILPGFETVKNVSNQTNNFDYDVPESYDELNNYNTQEGSYEKEEPQNNYSKPEPAYEDSYDEHNYSNDDLTGYDMKQKSNYVIQPNKEESINNGFNTNINESIPNISNTQDDFFGNNAYYENEDNHNIYQSSYDATSSSDIANLLSSGKQIATFVGTSKNGTSFIINNLAEYASSSGINVAVLDTTLNKNSYYIYTKNEEELRQVAATCLENLMSGQAKGISVNRNLTVYTSLPEDREELNNVNQILETLLRRHDLILIDCDFNTPAGYFANSQKTYLVQSLDILTIQPLTAFLRELKAHNVLDENKIRIILNKYVKVRGISEKTIIGGMSKYNDPAMSFMTDLFDVNTVDHRTIPFEQDIYTRYLESVINCDVSIKGYSKQFMQILKDLSSWVYPMVPGSNTYRPPQASYNGTFSTSMNDTLNQMKRKY